MAALLEPKVKEYGCLTEAWMVRLGKVVLLSAKEVVVEGLSRNVVRLGKVVLLSAKEVVLEGLSESAGLIFTERSQGWKH